MTDHPVYNYLIFFPGTGYYREMFRDAKRMDNVSAVFWSHAYNFFRRLACSGRFPEFVHRIVFRCFSRTIVRRFRRAVAGMADPDRPVCFIISRMFFYMLEKNLYGVLHEAFPGSKTVVLLTDLIGIHQWLEKIVLRQKDHPSADLIYTFDPAEAEKYHIHFHNLPFSDCSGLGLTAEESYDVYFFGRDKSRLDTIRQIHENLSGRGLRCSFQVTDVPREAQDKTGPEIRKRRWISYTKYLREEAKSRIILEIVQGESSGNTLRVYEAIVLGKKLITNNRHLKNNPAYDPENMFVFEKPEDIPDAFLRGKAGPYSEELKKQISLESFLRDIEENLNRTGTENV